MANLDPKRMAELHRQWAEESRESARKMRGLSNGLGGDAFAAAHKAADGMDETAAKYDERAEMLENLEPGQIVIGEKPEDY
jgi:hypothetical protein